MFPDVSVIQQPARFEELLPLKPFTLHFALNHIILHVNALMNTSLYNKSTHTEYKILLHKTKLTISKMIHRNIHYAFTVSFVTNQTIF